MPQAELLALEHGVQRAETDRTAAGGPFPRPGPRQPLPRLDQRVAAQVDPGQRRRRGRLACRLVRALLGGERLGLPRELRGPGEVPLERLQERRGCRSRGSAAGGSPPSALPAAAARSPVSSCPVGASVLRAARRAQVAQHGRALAPRPPLLLGQLGDQSRSGVDPGQERAQARSPSLRSAVRQARAGRDAQREPVALLLRPHRRGEVGRGRVGGLRPGRRPSG